MKKAFRGIPMATSPPRFDQYQGLPSICGNNGHTLLETFFVYVLGCRPGCHKKPPSGDGDVEETNMHSTASKRVHADLLLLSKRLLRFV